MLGQPPEYLIEIMFGHRLPENEAEELLYYIFGEALEGKKFYEIIEDEKFDYNSLTSQMLEYIFIAFYLGEKMNNQEIDTLTKTNKKNIH